MFERDLLLVLGATESLVPVTPVRVFERDLLLVLGTADTEHDNVTLDGENITVNGEAIWVS